MSTSKRDTRKRIAEYLGQGMSRVEAFHRLQGGVFSDRNLATILAATPDPALVDSALPTCLIEELVGYVWDANQLKDEPIGVNDHAMDMLRYVVRWARANLGALRGDDPYAADYGAGEDARLPAALRGR